MRICRNAEGVHGQRNIGNRKQIMTSLTDMKFLQSDYNLVVRVKSCSLMAFL